MGARGERGWQPVQDPAVGGHSGELRRIQSRLRAILDNAPVGLALRNLDGRYVHVNRYVARTLGAEPHELIGRHPGEHHDPPTAERIRREDAEMIRTRETVEQQISLRDADGRVRTFHVVRYPVLDEHGEVTGFGACSVDVTDRQAAEEALRQAEARHRRVIETLAEGVVLFDREGRNAQTNPAAARLIGMDADAAEGSELSDRRWRTVHEDGTEFTRDELPVEITRLTGEPQSGVIMTLVGPDGGMHWLSVHTRPLSTEEGPPYEVVASLSDIDALKRAEHEAQQRLEELERATGQNITVLEGLVAQSEVGLAFVDRDLRFVHLNDALARTTGQPLQAHRGRTPVEVLGEEGEPLQRLLAACLAGGRHVRDAELEIAPRGEGGESRVYRVSCWPVRDRGGETLGASAMLADVTVARRAARERELLIERERRAAERVSRLQRVSAALGGALGVSEVADVLVHEGAAALGMPRGWLSLVSPDGQTLDQVASTGVPVDNAYARVPIVAGSPGADALHSRQPVYFTHSGEQALAYPARSEAYRQAGNEAGAVFPILGAGGTLGTLAFADTRAREFATEERDLLQAIARQGAQALERASLYERERVTAETLSAALLPDRLPEIPGVALGCRYEPTAALHSAVGGDFYDVIQLGETSWLLVLGDVCGKGPQAAALTALVRHTLGTEARHTSDPQALLSVVNDAIRRHHAEPTPVTLAVCRLDLGPTNVPRLELVAAGHPAPIIQAPDGPTELSGARGQILGPFADPEFHPERRELPPGATVLLYSDGLLDAEAPMRSLEPGDVARVAAELRGRDPQTLVDDLFERFAPPGGPTRDDVALLAVRVQRSSGAGS